MWETDDVICYGLFLRSKLSFFKVFWGNYLASEDFKEPQAITKSHMLSITSLNVLRESMANASVPLMHSWTDRETQLMLCKHIEVSSLFGM